MSETLPNLIVIGGARTGTTSLHYYLGLHPEIFMSEVKELRFFTESVRTPERLAWYRSQFQPGIKFKIRGETSPQYTDYPHFQGVPRRIYSLAPGAKLIYILRDPVERMLSHFIFMAPEHAIEEPLDQFLTPLETNRYLAPSRQYWQLEQFLPYYPLSRIFLCTTEDLREQRVETLARMFRFLEVDDGFRSPEFSVALNASEPARRKRSPAGRLIKRVVDLQPGRAIPARLGLPLRNSLLRAFSRPVNAPRMSGAVEEKLRELFSADVRQLRQVTGMSFDRWRV